MAAILTSSPRSFQLSAMFPEQKSDPKPPNLGLLNNERIPSASILPQPMGSRLPVTRPVATSPRVYRGAECQRRASTLALKPGKCRDSSPSGHRDSTCRIRLLGKTRYLQLGTRFYIERPAPTSPAEGICNAGQKSRKLGCVGVDMLPTLRPESN